MSKISLKSILKKTFKKSKATKSKKKAKTKKIVKLKKVKNEEDIKQIGQTTNNLFVGTTTELQRLIQKENIIDVEPEE